MFELHQGFAYRRKGACGRWQTFYLAARWEDGDSQPTKWVWVRVSGNTCYVSPQHLRADPMMVRRVSVVGWSKACTTTGLRLVYVESGGSTVGQFRKPEE